MQIWSVLSDKSVIMASLLSQTQQDKHWNRLPITDQEMKIHVSHRKITVIKTCKGIAAGFVRQSSGFTLSPASENINIILF